MTSPRPSRPHTPPLSVRKLDVRDRALSLRSPSAPPTTRITPSRTVSKAALTVFPPRVYGSRAGSRVPSPADSVINMDMNEDSLFSEDVEVDPEEQIEGVFAESSADDEERRRHLRDTLRNTLKRGNTNITSSREPSQDESSVQVVLERASSLLSQANAGKNAFTILKGICYAYSLHFRQIKNTLRGTITRLPMPESPFSRPSEATEDVASIAGIASALVSVFADSTLSPSSSADLDKLRCINAGSTRITFLLRAPLYYVCVSEWGEPESVARSHLEYLHLQILSIVTSAQLHRKFERRTNFDLQRLLEGTEPFMHTLLHRLQTSIALFTTLSSLSSLRIDSDLRARTGAGLVPNSRTGTFDIIYAILVSSDSIITIIRPKKHTVHPSDLYVLMNAVNTSSVASNETSWLPICLPKFNPQRFVHAYVSYLAQDSLERSAPVMVSPVPSGLLNSETSSIVSGSHDNGDGSLCPPSGHQLKPKDDEPFALSKEDTQTTHVSYKNELALIVVSGGGDFDAVRRWSDDTVKNLESTGVLPQLRQAVKNGSYSSSELGIPGLRHFIYKNRVHVQATCPIWDDEYKRPEDQKRLITLYQLVHNAMHAKSGQAGPLRLQYIRTDKEAVLGWITHPFELYITLSPHLPKTAAVAAANAVARWAKREEARLFLLDAPTF